MAKNDQIFQLSLTEIAFTTCFILLLILGYLVAKEQNEKLEAQAKLAALQSTEDATAALDVAKSELSAALLNAGAVNPDEIVNRLVAVDEIRSERDHLRQSVLDLDAKLAALSDLRGLVEEAGLSRATEIARQEIELALALQHQIRLLLQASADPTVSRQILDQGALEQVRLAILTAGELRDQLKQQLAIDLDVGRREAIISEVVLAAKKQVALIQEGGDSELIRKENADLRGQLAFMKNKLDARGGRDFPPCWADEAGKVEFLFLVEVGTDSVKVSPAWPQRREAAARALPGIEGVLAGPNSYAAFVTSIQGIASWAKRQAPECRFYVQLKSAIADAVQSDRARLMVENYFYKVELRR